MELDPGTICARSSAGEAELRAAKSGLTLPQRKLLSLLVAPRAYAELAAENHLEPLRAARDLARLASLGLIVLHLPSSRTPRQGPPPAAADPHLRPVVLGGRGSSQARAPRIAMAATLVMAMGVGWIMFGGDPAPKPATPSSASSDAAAPALAAPVTLAGDTAPVAAPPASASAPPTGNAPSTRERSQDARPAEAAAATAGRAPGPSIAVPQRASAAEPSPAGTPGATAAAPSTSTGGIAPAAAVAPASSAASPTAPPAVPAPGPVAIAVPAPIAAAPQAAARSALQPVSREAPVFPREALAAGVTSGNVRARVTVDPNGKVTGVEIVESQPRRVFDRAVRNALERWQFEPGTESRTTEIEVAFSRD